MERRALAVRVDPDLTAVRFDDATSDEQTKAAPGLGPTRAVTSHERIEDSPLLVRWDLGTSILHTDLETILVPDDGDLDLRSRHAIDHRVSDEVADGRPHVHGVDPGHRAMRRKDRHAIVPPGLQATGLHSLLDDPDDVRTPTVERA